MARKRSASRRSPQGDCSTDLAIIHAAVKLGLLTSQQASEAMLLRKAKGGSTAFPQFLEDWGFLESDGRRTLMRLEAGGRKLEEEGDGNRDGEGAIRTAVPAGWLAMDETIPMAGPSSPSSSLQPPVALRPGGLGNFVASLPTLGPFEIIGELGKGGMGKVYLARDPRLDRTVALKVMAADLATHAEARKRFLREAQTAAGLDHPHIVKVHEVGEVPGLGAGASAKAAQPYIAMEYVEGTDLAHLLHPGRKGTGSFSRSEKVPVPLREALEIVRQVAEALAYAHEKGFVHRDVKPANVLVTTSSLQSPASSLPVAKLTDFGLARGAQSEGATRLTKTGVVMGTPHYMSPEQWDALPEKIQAPADQYAVGAMLYEVLTGEPPFAETADMRVLAAKAAGQDPPRPTAENPAVHRDLETIALKALEKEPEKRYASCKELAKDLGRFLAGEPIAARPAGRVERATKWVRRNRPLAGMGAAAAVAVLVLVGSLVQGKRAEWRAQAAKTEHIQGLFDAAVTARRALEAQSDAEPDAYLPVLSAYQEVLASDRNHEKANAAVQDLAAAMAQAKERRAERLVQAGRTAWQAYVAAAKKIEENEGKLKDAEERFPDWKSEQDKRPVFALKEKMQSLQRERAKQYANAIRQGQEALALVDGHQGARRLLADIYWVEFLKAEEANDQANTFLYESLCKQHDENEENGDAEQYMSRFDAGGTVTFDTAPTRADLYLFRYEPKQIGPAGEQVATRRLVPVPLDRGSLESTDPGDLPPGSGNAGSAEYPLAWGPANWVGRTPLPGLDLPQGKYLFLIRSPGKRDTRYPVVIRRETDWRSERTAVTDTAAAKAAVPVPIPLYTDREIGEDFVYVPPGPFLMGEPKELGTFGAKPPAEVWVDGFFMSRLEVSIEEYAEFLADQAFHTRDDPKADEHLVWPALTLGRDQQRRLPRQAPNTGAYFRIGPDGRPQVPDGWRGWPVLGISWEDAAAYVRWKNTRSRIDQDSAGNPADPATWPYRLAADEEWEKAARGVDGRAFVWGPEFDASLCRSGLSVQEGPENQPKPRGDKAGDESVYGVRDLAGSMREWCEDWETRDRFRLLRGGAWSDAGADSFRAAYRNGNEPVYVYTRSGFRLVRAARTPR